MEKDFRIEITRGSGPGGQHKNKVETCVKITHIPTGITETCQDTRYKSKNLVIAKKKILEKLDRLKEEQLQIERNNNRIERIKNPKRVRTYDFKSKKAFDHRTKKQAELDKVLNGEIDLLR